MSESPYSPYKDFNEFTDFDPKTAKDNDVISTDENYRKYTKDDLDAKFILIVKNILTMETPEYKILEQKSNNGELSWVHNETATLDPNVNYKTIMSGYKNGIVISGGRRKSRKSGNRRKSRKGRKSASRRSRRYRR